MFRKVLLETLSSLLKSRIKTWENEMNRVKVLTEKATEIQNKLDYRAQIDVILNDSSNTSVNDLLLNAKKALVRKNVKINYPTIQVEENISNRPKIKVSITASEFDKLRNQISAESKYNDYNFDRTSTSKIAGLLGN